MPSTTPLSSSRRAAIKRALDANLRGGAKRPDARKPGKPRARNFVKVGTIKIPWYRAGDGRTFVDPRRYGRKVFARSDHDEALREAHRIAIEINTGGIEVLPLSTEDRAIYAQTNTEATRRGRSPLGAITEWASAVDLIDAHPGARELSLLDVVRAGLGALCRAEHPTGEVVGELLNSKAALDLDGRYARDLRTQLRDFAAAFPGDIAAVTPTQVEQWLNERRNTKTGAALSPKRRQHIRANLIHLFKFARTRGYLPDRITSAQQVSALKVRRGEIGYFTPEEMRTLLKHALPDEVPWLVICGFSGVRVEEVGQSKHAADRKDFLRWEDVDWDEGEILIREQVAKTGHARRCPISDNLASLLAPYRHARGRIIPGDVDVLRDRFKRRLKRLAKQTDEITARLVHWPHNALRHSYGSYRMALIKDMARLADEMGDSVAIIKRHYNNPRSVSEAKAWFGIFPHAGENVIQLSLFREQRTAAGA